MFDNYLNGREKEDVIISSLNPKKIMVMGIGGCGCNLIQSMAGKNIDGINYVAANTDVQSLAFLKAKLKEAQVNEDNFTFLQLGPKVTNGSGAGSDPAVGAKAAEESSEKIRELIKGTSLLFLVSGMGGGTGTGAIPIIAAIAKECRILTVAVVTKPFNYEMAYKLKVACDGIEKLEDKVDTLLVVPNQKLVDSDDEGGLFFDAIKKADLILLSCIDSISEIIANASRINIDFADLEKILRLKGNAHIGKGITETPKGTEKRSEGASPLMRAVEQALENTFFETTIAGATGMILMFNINAFVASKDVTACVEHVKRNLDVNCNLITGINFEAGESVSVTIIAAGIPAASRNFGGNFNRGNAGGYSAQKGGVGDSRHEGGKMPGFLNLTNINR